MRRRIDAFLFDFGGVFTDSPFTAVEDFGRALDADPRTVATVVFGSYEHDGEHPWHRLERGEIGLEAAREQILGIGRERGIEVDIYQLFARMAPDVECDGEMHGDAALSESTRRNALMDSKLEGEANILICPNLDAANILFNVLKITGGHGVTVGPILLGAAASAHVITPSATVRRVVNMTALAVANAAHKPA